MGHALVEGRSSIKPTTSNTVRDKGSSTFGQPYLDPKSCPEQVVQSKPNENERKSRIPSKTCNDDELVKHMSNLPGFLQRVEKENSIQEKALNVGVLDWKRLEKWRYNERMPSKYPKKPSSSSSNPHRPTSVPPKMVPNLRKQPSYHALNPSSLSSGKFPMPSHDASRFFSPQRQPAPSHQSSHLNSLKEEKTVGNQKEVKDVEGMKLKGKETCNQVFEAAISRSVDKKQNDFHQRVEFYERSCSKTDMENDKRKDSKKEPLSEKEPSSSEQDKPKIDLYSTKKTSSVRKKNESTFSEEVKFDGNVMSECRKELISEKETSSSDQHKDMVTKNIETRFTDEVNITSECCTSDLQNNLSLPKNFSRRSCSGSSQFTESGTSIDGQFAEAIIVNRFSDFFSPLELYSGEFSTDVPHSCPLPFVGPVQAQSVTEPIERGAINEKSSTVKGRAPSPTRRFSFNLGRMSRSFSFKESSAIPQLTSQYTAVKSGPVRNEVSFSTENPEREKGNNSNRGRSSPLRRLLDPLLKYKPVEPVHSKDRKLEGSTFQALLQLTLKNGLPFFKLVVDNGSDMLAAAAKRSEKSDSCLDYVFYSIHEVKKKSMNWISQGSKSKNSALVCKTIGQMNILSSDYPNARECVLYGVDMQTPECGVPDKEIAAIVVKKSIQETSDEEETRKCDGMIVVLPGGIHGIPIKGAPSSLLSRWRSGGSCDCGGWDVGCKLQILCNDQQNASIGRVNLFVQGSEQKGKPVFSLEQLNNGFYSIELDTSISLLEAFATCVTCVTCRDFSEILDSNDTTASYVESFVGTDKKLKTPPITTFEAQIPAKYVTRPPLSPAGRI